MLVRFGYASIENGYCNPPSQKFFTSMDVTFDETKSFYIRHQLQGKVLLKSSPLNLLSHFAPFIHKLSHTNTTLGTPYTSRSTCCVDISKATPNKGISVPESRLTLEISCVCEATPNKDIFVLELETNPKISHLENFSHNIEADKINLT